MWPLPCWRWRRLGLGERGCLVWGSALLLLMSWVYKRSPALSHRTGWGLSSGCNARLGPESPSLALPFVSRGGAGSPGRCWSLALRGVALKRAPRTLPSHQSLLGVLASVAHRALLCTSTGYRRVLPASVSVSWRKFWPMLTSTPPVSAWAQVKVGHRTCEGPWHRRPRLCSSSPSSQVDSNSFNAQFPGLNFQSSLLFISASEYFNPWGGGLENSLPSRFPGHLPLLICSNQGQNVPGLSG